MDRDELIVLLIPIVIAIAIRVGARPLRRLAAELADRRRFARDLDRWITEMGLE